MTQLIYDSNTVVPKTNLGLDPLKVPNMLMDPKILKEFETS